MELRDVEKWVKDDGIEYFLCSFVEMGGMPKAKLVPATNLQDMAAEGAGFAGFAAGNMGQGPHSPELANMPDFGQGMIVPWRPNMAWVPGNLEVEGEPFDYCPRTILNRQLERARALGYRFNVGVEAEFILLKRGEEGRFTTSDPFDTLDKPCYDLVTLNRNFDLMTTLIGHLQTLGWGPYANDHEDANCQFEINWEYSDALTTADRHTFYRWMVKTMAEERGLHATFHAQALRRPHRLGRPLPHEPVGHGQRDQPLPRRERPQRAVADGLPLHGRRPRPRPGPRGRHRTAGQQLQAPHPRRPPLRRQLGPGLRHLRRLQPHPDDPHPGPRPHREPLRRRRRQPLPGQRGGSWPPASTASRTRPTPAAATTRTSTS